MGLPSLKKGNKKCAVCNSALEPASPVEDLCGACYRLCVQTEAALRYLQNTSVAHLNIIQKAAAQNMQIAPERKPIVDPITTVSRETPPIVPDDTAIPRIPRYAIVRTKTKERFVLSKQINRIGKSEELADISVSDNNTLSRCHAALEKTATGVLLWDCGSKNGTRLGAERLAPDQKVAVHPGDTFRLANEEFMLVEE